MTAPGRHPHTRPDLTSGTRTARRRRLRLLAATGAVLVVLLGACSAASDSDSAGSSVADQGVESAPSASDDDSGGAADAAAPEAGVEDGSVSQPANGSTVADVDASGALEPRRIRRGQVAVEVEDLTLAAARVRDLAAGLQGYVSDESVSTAAAGTFGVGEGRPSLTVGPDSDEQVPESVPGEGRLVLRVPPDQMQAAMDGIGEVGEELTRWSGETNVELTLVDLESRIATQEQSVADVRALMDRATTLDDIIMLEREVSSRTADLEALKAQQASVAGEAGMATVTAVLRTATAQQAVEEERTGFVGGLFSGLNALQGSVGVLLTIVGALLPFALIAGAVGYPLYRVLRRRRVARALVPAGPAGTYLQPAGAYVPAGGPQGQPQTRPQGQPQGQPQTETRAQPQAQPEMRTRPPGADPEKG